MVYDDEKMNQESKTPMAGNEDKSTQKSGQGQQSDQGYASEIRPGQTDNQSGEPKSEEYFSELSHTDRLSDDDDTTETDYLGWKDDSDL